MDLPGHAKIFHNKRGSSIASLECGIQLAAWTAKHELDEMIATHGVNRFRRDALTIA